MTEQSNPFTSWPGQSDPMTTSLGILIDMWSNGLSAWEMLASGGSGRHGDQTTAPPFSAMLGPMAEMARLFDAVSSATGLGATATASEAAVSQDFDMSPAIAQACGIATVSLMRYWSILAELQLRYQRSLMQAAAARAKGQAASPTECRLLADEVRAFLRGIGDAATLEARRMQQELEKVGEAVARAADQATPSQHPHRRRHEVKK